MYKDGTLKTTKRGYSNWNNQKVYGVNGSDIYQRQCPKCQGGNPGIEY